MAYYLEIELKKNGTKEEQERGNIHINLDASKRIFTKHRYKPCEAKPESPSRTFEVVKLKRRIVSR